MSYLIRKLDYRNIYRTMGYEGAAGQSLKYVIWLRQLRDGLRGLAYYSYINKKWMDVGFVLVFSGVYPFI